MHARHAASLLAAVVAGACATPSNPHQLHLADLVPVVGHGVSTEIILPPFEGSDALLGEGWEQASTAQARDEGLWIVGSVGRFRFHAGVAGGVLEAEATALQTSDSAQVLELEVNGMLVHREAMAPGWARYEFPLPPDAVVIGWNDVALRFAQATRPHDLDPASPDRRPLAARFRRLRVRSPLERGLWTERPQAIEVVGGAADEPVDVVMPTDSTLDIYVQPDGAAKLSGRVRTVTADASDEAGPLAAIELAEESGRTHQLLEVPHDEGRGGRTFSVDLQAWRGQAVRLRFRCWGEANGTARWSDVIVAAAADPSVAEVVPAGNLVVPPRSGRLGTPDVIVIVLDAARSDAFGGAEQAPHVDRLARDGTRFLRARAPSPWTGQTIPSLLTGRYPGSIGINTWGSRLPDDVATLPELLTSSAYHTVIWSQHNIYRGNATLRRGLASFAEVRSDVLADRELLPAADALFVDDQPSFALIHLLPPHGPYEPPEPFRGTLSDWYTGDFPISAAALNRAARPVGRKPTADDVRYVRARYDENAAFADALVGRLIEMLQAAGRYDDAVIVLTSDHGEAFYEHGYFLHTRLLYDEFLRVPLVVKWPRASVGFTPTVDDDVTLVDLAPTLIDGLAVASEPGGFQGRTLLPLVFDGVAPDRTVFAQTNGVARSDVDPRPARTVVTGSYKLTMSDVADEIELFNLDADPAEQQNLAQEEPFRARALLQDLLLQRHRNAVALSQHVQQPEQPLDPETIRKLRALGYLR